MSQEHENIAGGMSYRTMDDIDNSLILKYLEGCDFHSKTTILNKNKTYYIASADKTIARLKLAQTRLKYSNISEDRAKKIYKKISECIQWLGSLKDRIRYENNPEILKLQQYKKWHAVKLIPSAVEGYIIISQIRCELPENKINTGDLTENTKFSAITEHVEKAEMIFKLLFDVNENSDFRKYENLRVEGYNETATALKLIKSFSNQNQSDI